MSSPVSSLSSKPVRDARDRPFGRVAGSQVQPDTRGPSWLLVELAPEAAGELNGEGRFCWLPYAAVGGIRRDAVRLAERAGLVLEEVDGPVSRPQP